MFRAASVSVNLRLMDQAYLRGRSACATKGCYDQQSLQGLRHC
jgi:hypothetical protein